MKTFINDDFLLYNDTAKELYHNTAKDMPIIDYHNHLIPSEILEDKKFENIADIWLGGDHYKWRAMRANGIEEDYITGNKSPEEKFKKWAATVPKMLGNPLYHWTHLELLRYFQIDELLDEKSGSEIYQEANRLLKTEDFSVRNLLRRQNVKFVGTTDDPVDNLANHQAIRKEGLDMEVSPSFRPDKGLFIDREEFLSWVEKLEEAVDCSISSYQDFLDAFKSRVNYFDKHGCRSSDHGLDEFFFEEATGAEVANIFKKRINQEKLTKKEIDQFKTYTLLFLAECYDEKGWAMQLHLGALRNNHGLMFEKLGPDTGYDSIGDLQIANKLSSFLNTLATKDKLPKTVLYSLNANDYDVLASMAGNFQNAEVPGKVQFGTAWWFNDTIDGMKKQMNTLANIGLISNFVGMLTDSRSFLSFPRHEYFRRILCNLLGSWVEQGKAPKDIPLLETYVKDICFYNAKNYFRIN